LEVLLEGVLFLEEVSLEEIFFFEEAFLLEVLGEEVFLL
jgi:hypothetical protein